MEKELIERISRIEKKIDILTLNQLKDQDQQEQLVFSPFLRAMGIKPEDVKNNREVQAAPELLNIRMICELLYEKYDRQYSQKEWQSKIAHAINTGKINIYEEDGSLRTSKTNKPRMFSVNEVLDYMSKNAGNFRRRPAKASPKTKKKAVKN